MVDTPCFVLGTRTAWWGHGDEESSSCAGLLPRLSTTQTCFLLRNTVLSLCPCCQPGPALACLYPRQPTFVLDCSLTSPPGCPSALALNCQPWPDRAPRRPQTAHDPAYLVKHLLAGLPDVTTRVQQMRQSRTTSGSNTAADKWLEMEASKEAYVKVRTQLCLHASLCTATKCYYKNHTWPLACVKVRARVLPAGKSGRTQNVLVLWLLHPTRFGKLSRESCRQLRLLAERHTSAARELLK